MRPGSARPFCPRRDLAPACPFCPRCDPAPHPGTRTGSASRGCLGGLDDLQMGPCDARPGAAGIELKVALPVLDGLTIAAVARQGSGEVEVGVGVVGRELERSAIVDDRLFDCAAVLVERAEVVGGLTAPGILVERRGIRRLRLIVTAHAMQKQTEVVPGGGVCGVDRDAPAVGADCVLPLGRIAVPLAGTLEPRLGLIGGRRQRTHETSRQRGSGRRLETARIECQHPLAPSRVEADAIGLGDQPISLHRQTQLRQRMLAGPVPPPPGGIPAVTPARATTSSPSRNGKTASDAHTVAAVSRPSSWARITASRAESTRFIWPAPTPITWPAVVSTIAFDFACFATRQANRSASRSAAVGARVDTV